MDTEKSPEVIHPSVKMDRRAFLLALSGSAFVLAGGTLLAGCGGGGSNPISNLSSSSSSSSSSTSSISSSSSSSSAGASPFAGHYTGMTTSKFSDGSTDNGTVVFDVDSAGNVTGTFTDVTNGNAPTPITGSVDSTGHGTLKNQKATGAGQFTVGAGGLITVSGTITGSNNDGSLTVTSGTFAASTSTSSSSS